MFSNAAISIIIAALTASAALANPISRAATVSPNFPVSDRTISRANTTVHADVSKVAQRIALGRHAGLAARQEFPADLLLCPSANCASCFEVNLDGAVLDECETLGEAFISVAISQPGNVGLPFEVLVGPAGCAEFAQIPAVNECFNINEDFETFALVE